MSYLAVASFRRSFVLVSLLLGAFLLFAPVTAEATIRIEDEKLVVEVDDLPASNVANEMMISEDVGLTGWSIQPVGGMASLPEPGPGCVEEPGFPANVFCAYSAGVFELNPVIFVTLGTGDDRVQVLGGATSHLYGGDGADTLTGGPREDLVDGGPGNDELWGTAGNDLMYGGTGIDALDGGLGTDTLEIRDGDDDGLIDCGTGTNGGELSDPEPPLGDILRADLLPADANVVNCENRERQAFDPGTGTGGGGAGTVTGTGSGTGTSATTGETKVEPKVEPGFDFGGVKFETVIDTGRPVTIPDLRGKDPLAAFLILQKAGINFDLQPFPMNSLRKNLPKSVKPLAKWDDGDIVIQEKAKVGVISGSRSTVTIVVRYWEGPTVETCAQELKDFIGLPAAQFEEIAKREKCKIDDTKVAIVKTTKKVGEIDASSGDRCEVSKVVASGKAVDTVLSIPRDPALQDLRIVVLSGSKTNTSGPGPSSKDWSYISGSNNNLLYIKVLTRSGQPLDDVKITVDTGATWPDAVPADAQTDGYTISQLGVGGGMFEKKFRTGRKAGMILIAAKYTDSKGHSVCGSAEIPSKLVGSGKGGAPAKGDKFETAGGYTFKYTTSTGQWAYSKMTAKSTARSGRANFLDNLLKAIGSIFTGVHAVPGKASTQGHTSSGVILGQISMGQPLKGNASISNIISGGAGNVIGIGAGNIISGGAGNIISGGAGNIVAGGAGNVLVGLNGSSIISGGGGNIISGGAGNIISGGAGNIISGGAGNVLSTTIDGSSAQVVVAGGAGHIISGGAGNIISAGAGNVMAAGNIISGGAGN
ncbi:MAG: Hemolysin-type calcium-binding region [Thermoleophilia bacterium]|nr:Hemolysin-type calcium-binding region [Thermoleophilia bacterium]